MARPLIDPRLGTAIEQTHLTSTVTIQQPTTTTDTEGRISEAWADLYADIPASVQPISGREALIAAQEESQLTHTVTIRWRAGVRAPMRVKEGSRVLEIRDVRDLVDQHLFLALDCQELHP